MVRKTAVLASALALAASVLVAWGSPASASHGGSGTFTAPVPGTVLTPYWLDLVTCIGCNPDGLVRQTIKPVHDKPIFNGRDFVEVCDKPFPPSGFAIKGIGSGASHSGLKATVTPPIDWDMAICALRGPSTDELKADPTDTKTRWREDGFAANDATSPCPNPIGVSEIPVGCIDSATISVKAVQYRLIGYNWSDLPEAPYKYNFF